MVYSPASNVPLDHKPTGGLNCNRATDPTSAFDVYSKGDNASRSGIGQESLDYWAGQFGKINIPVAGTPYVGTPEPPEEPKKSAYEILEEMAESAFTKPHITPEADIQILAAFVLGYNSK